MLLTPHRFQVLLRARARLLLQSNEALQEQSRMQSEHGWERRRLSSPKCCVQLRSWPNACSAQPGTGGQAWAQHFPWLWRAARAEGVHTTQIVLLDGC